MWQAQEQPSTSSHVGGRQMETAGTIGELEWHWDSDSRGLGELGKPPPPGEQIKEERELLPKFQSWLCYSVAV